MLGKVVGSLDIIYPFVISLSGEQGEERGGVD